MISHTALSALNDLGGALVPWFLWMNIWTAAILLVVLLIDRIVRRRLSPSARIALYAVVFVRLVVPLAWDSPMALLQVMGEPVAVTEGGYVQLADAPSPGGPGGMLAGTSLLSSPARARPALRWSGVICLGYATIAVGLFAVWVVARIRLAWRLRSSSPARASIAVMRPDIHIIEAEGIGPAIVGIARPRTVLPRELCDRFDQHQIGVPTMRWILDHERAHIRRGDHITLALLQCILIGCWPILALWLAGRRIRQLMEQASDAAAIGADAPVAHRRAYGRALVALSDERHGNGGIATLAMLGHASTNLHARVHAMLSTARAWPRSVQGALVLCGGVALLAMSTTSSAAGDVNRAPAERDMQAHDDERQILITIRVFDAWPSDERIQFNLGQHGDGEEPEDEPAHTNTMSPAEYAAYLERVAQTPDASIITSPRLLVTSGQTGSITVSSDPEAAGPDVTFGIHATATPTIDDTTGRVHVRFAYRAAGLDVRPPASEVDHGDVIRIPAGAFELESGHTKFLLATGFIGAPMHMVAVTAESIEHLDELDLPAAAAARPQIEFYAVVWEFDAKPDISGVIPAEYRLHDPEEAGVAAAERAFSQLSFLPNDAFRPFLQWLREHGRGTSVGGKDGARIFAPGESARIAVQPDGGRGYTVDVAGEILDNGLPVTEIAFNHARNPEQDVDSADPRLQPFVGRFVIPSDHWAVVPIAATEGAPWRIMLCRSRVVSD